MNKYGSRLFGERGLSHARVKIEESIDGRYLITISFYIWKGLKEIKVARMWFEDLDEAWRVFNAIF